MWTILSDLNRYLLLFNCVPSFKEKIAKLNFVYFLAHFLLRAVKAVKDAGKSCSLSYIRG